MGLFKKKDSDSFLPDMAIQVVEFSIWGYKIRKIFALESTYRKVTSTNARY